MFSKVMVAVDGEAGGRDAIALARQLVDPDGELVGACVHRGYQIDAGERSGSGHALRDPFLKDLNKSGSSDDYAPMLTVTATSVGRGLHTLAEREGVDLMVVGSCRRGVVDRVLLSDATREALNGAPCAIAVATAGYARQPRTLARVGLAYNESIESDHALRVAKTICGAHQAKLAVMEVIKLPAYFYNGYGAANTKLAEPWLAATSRQLKGLGEVEPHPAIGNTCAQLTGFSAEVDLLVLGARDYGPAGRLVHSSVSKQLARASHCPLLVLNRGARAGGPALTEKQSNQRAGGQKPPARNSIAV